MTTHGGEAVFSGVWPGDIRWDFFLSDDIPNDAPLTTVTCVALRNLVAGDVDGTEVVLTHNVSGRGTSSPGSWEMPGGHIEPVDLSDPDGPKETPEQTLAREALEEAGFVIATAGLVGYRRVNNPPPSKYPEINYTPVYWATTESPLQTPTDPESTPACGTFRVDALRRLALTDDIHQDELKIIEFGVRAALDALAKTT